MEWSITIASTIMPCARSLALLPLIDCIYTVDQLTRIMRSIALLLMACRFEPLFDMDVFVSCSVFDEYVIRWWKQSKESYCKWEHTEMMFGLFFLALTYNTLQKRAKNLTYSMFPIITLLRFMIKVSLFLQSAHHF